ncbi:hypothetical protein PFICI_13322 [Pestalotiopsis fici W106-1]|uniref:Uncharacterized protein n=1 Tax=Pestalotiopsis fici (strain W106-1 / CGMCC3.15140) TaxID=1229662 RepID=W3WLU7_PESFW|nr:uncharacterized protein PFICI_13322 [Pestalotiopsis fici W106-1]ETS74838.1 hypothetical protein PFICI_13322 [Pestalotiopsis fici W106-1]
MIGTQAQQPTPGAKAGPDVQASVEGQSSNSTEPPLMAGANGSSSLGKKRKKEGLKPIITTEGPSPTG